MSTKIEWTDMTWNFVRGCRRVSPGCENCYAERQAIRFAKPGEAYNGLVKSTPNGPRWTGKFAFDKARLLAPLKRRTPTKYFVNSMSDLFHEDVTDEMLDKAFAVMALCPQHIFQTLTKRPGRMKAYLSEPERHHLVDEAMCEFDNFHSVNGESPEWPLPNCWLGVSVENQPYADERIPLLLDTPAAVRWISAEPLLGPIDLRRYLGNSLSGCESCDCNLAFDDEVRHDGNKECGNVEIAVDVPRAHRLPTAPLDSLVVPTDPTTESGVKPVDNFGRGAVDGNSDAVGSVGSLADSDVPFAVQHSGDVTDDRGVGGDADCLPLNRPAISSKNDTGSGQSALDSGSTDTELLTDSSERMTSLVIRDRLCYCNCHRFHNSNYNPSLSWIVVGGESGPGARPCDIAHIGSIVEQCKSAGVPVFVKQLGKVPYATGDANTTRVWPHSKQFQVRNQIHTRLHSSKGGDPSEWPEDLRVREFPTTEAAG